MSTIRTGHQAALLPSGQVLVIGGFGSAALLNTTERYDPATNTWTAGSPMLRARAGFRAVSLRDGRVLVIGGDGPDSTVSTAELYDPIADRWQPAASLQQPRTDFTATVLADGRVLVVGSGYLTGFQGADTPEIYDPATNTWTVTTRTATRHAGQVATLLANGQVLVTGYFSVHSGYVATSADAEVYDPVTNRWTAAPPLHVRRGDHTATLLPSGAVLVTGGIAGFGGQVPNPGEPVGTLASAELYQGAALALPGLPNTGGGGRPGPVAPPGVALAGLLLALGAAFACGQRHRKRRVG